MKYFIIVAFLFKAGIALANNSTIQDKVSDEYGSCYQNFNKQIAACNPSSCNYPDFSDAKTWRTHVIRGMTNNKCYVIYYSYLGSDIVGIPQHCFYSIDDMDKVSKLYNTLFGTNSAIEMADIRDQINQLNNNLCKTEIVKNNASK